MASPAASQAAEAVSNSSGQPAWAIFLSAGVILAAAVIGVFWQRRISRQTLTLTLIERQLWDQDYIKARKGFIAIRDGSSKDQLKTLALPASAGTDDAATVRSILNNYELISIGISSGVLDAAMYKTYFRGTFVSDHEAISSFIQSAQTISPKAYKEYGALYEKWRQG